MVERPIKRAELEARRAAEAANPSPEGAPTEAKSSEPRRGDKRDSRDSRDKGGKGGKRGFDDDAKQSPVNLALVRGPKPQKAKPPEPEPEVVEEPIGDAEADTAAEASEAPAEAAAAAPEAAAE
jgi:hypothetical protein